MAEFEKSASAQNMIRISEIESAVVSLTGTDRLRVEFRIDDLVRRLIPGGGGSPVANCGGCNGCTGCSM